MSKRLAIPVLLALVAVLALVQFVSATPPGAPLAQATASPVAQSTAEGATTPAAQETPLPPPNRGCLACHVQIEADGRFALAWEATERMEAQGKEHPPLPLDTKFETCLTCHNGSVAKPMSSIVHPAHMFSPIFTAEFRGNCFSCHEIDKGEFMVLVDKQNVNDKGVIQPAPAGGQTPAAPGATATP